MTGYCLELFSGRLYEGGLYSINPEKKPVLPILVFILDCLSGSGKFQIGFQRYVLAGGPTTDIGNLLSKFTHSCAWLVVGIELKIPEKHACTTQNNIKSRFLLIH